MTTPGDDDQFPDPPPDPFHTPTGGSVDHPRFGDGGTDEYAPDYGAAGRPADAAAPNAGQRPPPPGPGQHPGTPNPTPYPAAPIPAGSSKAADSRRGLIAPIAAGLVLIGGVGLLIVSSGSDEPKVTTTPRIAEVGDPDEPLVESTVPGDSVVEVSVPDDSIVAPPVMTSPPLFEPTTTVEDVTEPTVAESTTTTAATDSGGPSQAELDAALIGIEDIGPGDWFEEEPAFDDFCGTDLNQAAIDVRSDALYQTLLTDPIAVRQVSHSLISYPDADTAALAFTNEVDALLACNGTTQDLDGTSYRVQVDSVPFSEDDLSTVDCGDQSSFLLTQLFNEAAVPEYIGQSAFAFRCGRNVVITTLGSTIDADDLNDDAFFLVVAAANIGAGELTGSN